MIPLQDYLEALMGSFVDYVQLTPKQTKVVEAELIRIMNDTGAICTYPAPAIPYTIFQNWIIESEKDTLYPGSTLILPPLTHGEKRLWYKAAWDFYNGPEAKEEFKKWKIRQMLKEHLKS